MRQARCFPGKIMLAKNQFKGGIILVRKNLQSPSPNLKKQSNIALTKRFRKACKKMNKRCFKNSIRRSLIK